MIIEISSANLQKADMFQICGKIKTKALSLEKKSMDSAEILYKSNETLLSQPVTTYCKQTTNSLPPPPPPSFLNPSHCARTYKKRRVVLSLTTAELKKKCYHLYYKWKLNCKVFWANRIDRIEPLLSQPHNET